ncbi:secreted RxLR effector peptide protein, putative [Phytophthora infestans T30-4]|uniref:RxLR effector protein n=2 Tax=Phytophthora infestans TaxID=4787 RepID=D0NCS5_PHYIT|nr:secreted RxLR effector peptide protein, putative [Phytophthora infestans T30-4]EEY55789.1 secreted RxLR effector peptide protein, putative [Phytophthora infestans T30-4]KAF4028117.1 hypothetical protein GN244_ATG20220 [Phytophthora infestans]KAF4042027.1 hypothetical protein GN244_ATG05752 [Phytophthora infestans]KAF4139659.1 hypothetical protein GN958_ATG11144 [Phytophthora infestans]|eukprot:XP_002903365.1 secreted RxLR effector peptide protein, putative [Phytophthora infestans T30-4]
MHLSRALLMIAAALLATSNALSNSNAASTSNTALPSDSAQRLLRAHASHDTTAAEEERHAPFERVNSLAKKYDIDLGKAAADVSYFLTLDKQLLQEYQTALAKLHEAYRPNKNPR